MNKFPQGWHVDFTQPFKMPQVAAPARTLGSQGSSIDSKCIVHPPQRFSGALSAGTPILQNRYPALKIMPADVDREKLQAKVEEIPLQWPRMKLDSIPTSWPKFDLKPIAEKDPLLPPAL